MDYAINHRISYYLELLIIINGSFPDGHQAITESVFTNYQQGPVAFNIQRQ